MPSQRIHIRIAEDGLEAFADLVAGPPCGEDELREALTAAGVVEGVDEAALSKLLRCLEQPDGALEGASVAVGRAPVAGRDAGLELAFETDLRPGRERSDGSLDFHDRGLVKQVQPGEAIAHWRAASAGEPGLAVDGKPLAAEAGNDTPLGLGDGVELDGEAQVRARRAGAIVWDDEGGLDVVELYTHTGDVDLRSGNLDFDGSLLVTGDLRPGSRVRASRDIEVKGALEAARVRAGGRLQLGGGAWPESFARAGVSLETSQVRGARLRCEGAVAVQSDCLDGSVTGREVAVGRRAVGGRIVAESRIEVGDAGSPAGGPLLLRAAEPLLEATAGATKAPRAPRSRGRSKGRAGERERADLKDAEIARKREWRRRQRELARSACVEVSGCVHPGVTIEIAGVRLPVEDSLRAKRFRLDAESGDIQIESLSG